MRENMTLHSFPYLEILNNLDIGIALFDAEGNYLFVNTELVNWRNIPMLEFLKMNVHDFLNILDVCVFDLVKKKNHRVSRLQYYKNKDHVDSKRRLRVVTGTPIFDENGKIKYVIMALQDVESFENLYQALLRQNQIVSFGSGKELVELRAVHSARSLKWQIMWHPWIPPCSSTESQEAEKRFSQITSIREVIGEKSR